jgi:divalent metal cation (Fe/Co/Zn/Cd) transporter
MEARSRQVTRTLVLVLGANLAVAVLELAVGRRVGSLALGADGVHSLLDASSNVVGLIG